MRHIARFLTAAVAAMSLLVASPWPGAAEEATLNNAYLHLDEAMDEWAPAPELRVPSSYHGGEKDSWDNSVTYDNALVIIAYANRRQNPDSLARARTMGDALLKMQANDPAGDGRVRNAYGPENLFNANGVPNIQTWGAASGNQAWAGMALAHLAHVTGETAYRDGAVRIGEWLVRETKDTRGAGGFTGGYEGSSKKEWKSSEHNIDMIGLFGMLHQLTGDDTWAQQRDHARGFVESMWDQGEGRFHIGSESDGVTINRDEYIPEDVQSWGYLALRDDRYRRALDWSLANLEVTDESNAEAHILGVRFAKQTDPDKDGRNDRTVWLEGTAHMALALRVSGTQAHGERARAYLASIELEQRHGEDADGKGIPANSQRGYSGGDDMNPTSLHTGATAWYAMARQGIDPFHLAGK